MRVARKALAAGIIATFAGTMVEIEAAGPFRPVAWWRAPLTGAGIAAAALVLGWAQHELSGRTDDVDG